MGRGMVGSQEGDKSGLGALNNSDAPKCTSYLLGLTPTVHIYLQTLSGRIS